MAETLKSSSSFPLEDFDICLQWSFSLHRNVSLATIPSAIRAAGLAARPLARSVMRLLGTWCVPGLQGVMKFRLLVVFRSHPSVVTGALFVHILPCVACLSPAPIPVAHVTLPCAWPCMQEGWLVRGVGLNFHLTLTSVHGFSRGSQVWGVFFIY